MVNMLIVIFECIATLLFPLGQFARLSFSNQQVNIYPYELIIVAVFTILFLKYRLAPFRDLKNYKRILLFLGLLGLSFVFTVFSYDLYSNYVGFLYFLRILLYFLHFIYLTYHLRKQAIGRRYLYMELIFITLALIISSLFQYIYYPNLRNLIYQGWDPHLYRVFSFFFEPYAAGAALGLSLIFVYFRWGKMKKIRIMRYGIIFILFVLLMLTFSRTVYLAMFASSVILFLKKKRYWLIGFTLFAFIVVAFVIPKPVGVGVQLLRTFSIDTRVNNSLEGLNLWTKTPILGVGYDRIRYRKAQLGQAGKYDDSHAASAYHSSFVTMLVAGGGLGFIPFLLMLIDLGSISATAGYYILFLSILSFGDNALLHPFLMFYYLKLISFEKVQSSLE